MAARSEWRKKYIWIENRKWEMDAMRCASKKISKLNYKILSGKLFGETNEFTWPRALHFLSSFLWFDLDFFSLGRCSWCVPRCAHRHLMASSQYTLARAQLSWSRRINGRRMVTGRHWSDHQSEPIAVETCSDVVRDTKSEKKNKRKKRRRNGI